jgi:hypothetical protein
MALLGVFRGLPGGAILRKSSAQARIDRRNPTIWPDDDFAIIDGATPVGRIYRELILGEPKWLRPVHQIPEAGPGRPVPPPIDVRLTAAYPLIASVPGECW